MSTSTSHPSTSSPDIPFHGFVETTADALRLIQAARQGVIPRITRRLNEEERVTIVRSGAVFVFSVEESGIRRWTEGLSWSASRIAGNFLLYRELASRNSGRTSYTGKALQSDSAFSRRKVVPKESDSQTITVCADGTQYHLISYYTDDDFRSKRLQRPIRRPDIMALGIPADLLDASNFRYPPRIDVNGGGSIVDMCV
ncbi:hypothetical protein BDM02DRAFT_3095860 [Thelephora ganbajun]|uniref:Uncharacterized protein n=1 Tax=Thelephora ganbajun TaxID=370292 RepID=A0ACB6ZGS3_THEGA|nr:hypothetical protein BDM02DRAFT_3095860 [Thelephora ganbajun]